MSLYLYQNDQQTGPFTEEQIRQMLQSGAVTRETLGWKEGMAGWEPLTNFLISSTDTSLPPPPPVLRGSPLGMGSFIFGAVSVVVWAVFLVIAGVMHNAGRATETFNMILGLALMGWGLLNFVAMVLGVIGAFQSRKRVFSILGASLNGFFIVALVGMMLLGLAVKNAKKNKAANSETTSSMDSR